nr:MAG TPA: hypothetical protein [Caudoviricetes sp.]
MPTGNAGKVKWKALRVTRRPMKSERRPWPCRARASVLGAQYVCKIL